LKPEMEILCKEKCYKIVGSCMTVHTELGHGFLEAIYQEALALELKSLGITFDREREIKVLYKGIALNKPHIADFICCDKIIVELKALSCLTNDHVAQLLNYMKATGLRVGLLVNFGSPSLEHYKYVL
jgi:GxxExxY protein